MNHEILGSQTFDSTFEEDEDSLRNGSGMEDDSITSHRSGQLSKHNIDIDDTRSWVQESSKKHQKQQGKKKAVV